MADAHRYRWVVLAVGALAQGSTAMFFLGIAAITPALRATYGIGVAQVGALVGVVSVGIVATMILWGGAADRFGERGVMTVGLVGAAAALAGAAFTTGPIAAGALFVVAGAFAAGVNAASGRAVLTWFPARHRGLAMAVRQTSVPVGAAVAAVVLPAVAGRSGVPGVFVTLACVNVVAAGAVAVWIREPPDVALRTSGPRTSVRAVLGDTRLLRLSLAGFLLVVPQFLGSTLLVEVLHDGAGMSLEIAGTLLAVTQVLGAAGRLGAGAWSDRVGSRLGPLRVIAAATAVGFGLAAAVEPGPAPLLAAVLVPAAALAISWNGLVFTAAGELAAPDRAATAMAVSNTANFAAAAAAPFAGGLLAQSFGWPAALALGTVTALTALLALRGLPGRRDQPDPSWAATGAQNSRTRS